MLGLGSSLAKGGASLLTFVKDNLKLYLDFKSNKSDTLKFPCEGSTYFSGSNQYIEIADNSDLDIAQGESLTFACWLNVQDTGTNELIFSKRHSDIGYSITWHSSEKPVFYIRDSAGNNYYSYTSDVLSYNTWYHYAVVWNPSTMKATHYVNGIDAGRSFENNATLVDASNSGVARIGIPADSTSYDFKGYLANIGIWKRVLSQEEIQSIMNKSYSQLKGVEKTSLVSWWALDTETLSDNLATAWTNASADAETLTTSGANITSLVNSSGHANVNLNAFATQYRVYKLSYDYTLVSGTDPKFFSATGNTQDSNVPTSATFASLGSSWYYTADTGNSFSIWSSSTFSITVDNFSVKAVISADSHGSNTGYYSAPKSSAVSSHNSATTTTSVYGGNAPVLPRAVDVAKEGQADAIGNGSAFFTVADDDYIDFGDFQAFTTQMSVTAWVKFNAVSNTQAIIGHFDYPNNQRSWSLAWLDDTTNYLRFFVSGDGSSYKYNRVEWTPTAKEWYHISATYNAGTSKLYINGIEQTVTAESSQPTSLHNSTGSMFIGAVGNSSTNADHFDGNISQVGLWQGALTQAQIQSVMESTSYNKIPASVKSTLGAETLTHNFSDGTGVTVPSSLSVASGKTTFNGEMVINGGDVSSDYYSIADNVAWDTSKVYKIVVVCSAYTSGSLTHQGGSASFGINFGISSSIGGVGTFTNYAVPYQNQSITLRSQSFVGTLSSISIKEVINDIVGYWDLDSSDYTSASNHITNGDASSSSPVKPEWNISGQTFTYNEYNASIARVTDFGSSGNTSWKITASSGSHNWGMKTTDADMNVGRSYKVSCKVYIPSSTDISSVAMRWYKGSSGTGESVSTSTKDSWTELTFTIPSFWSNDGSYAQIVNFTGNGASASDYFYFDDLVIKPHSVPDSTDNNNAGDLI